MYSSTDIKISYAKICLVIACKQKVITSLEVVTSGICLGFSSVGCAITKSPPYDKAETKKADMFESQATNWLQNILFQ